jgi:hypothetical protein
MSDDEKVLSEMRMPVSYIDPRTGQQVGSSAPVMTLTKQEIEQYCGGKMCGNCTFFEPGHAVVEMARQRFMPKLVKELEWKPEHLGAAISSEAGLCGLRDDLLTSTFTKSCDAWREDRGRLKKRATPAEKAAWEEERRTMMRMHRERMARQHKKHLQQIGMLPPDDK